jgi:hypothetical protein
LAVTHMALQKMTFSVRHKNNSTTFHVLLLNIYTQSFLIFYICLYLTKIDRIRFPKSYCLLKILIMHLLYIVPRRGCRILC